MLRGHDPRLCRHAGRHGGRAACPASLRPTAAGGLCSCAWGRWVSARRGWPRKWPTARGTAVAVSEQAGVRFLHIGGDAIQSAMRLSKPDRLELHYTRAMMGFLLFHPKPRKVLMIGLGGGSMARFLHKAFPRLRVTALDVSPEVVAAARRHFDFPADGP